MASTRMQRDFSALKRRGRGRTCSWADDDLDEQIAVKIESDDDLSTGSTTAVDDTSSRRLSDSSEDSAWPQASSEEESPQAATSHGAFAPSAGGFFHMAMPMMTSMSPMASGVAMAPQFYMMSMAPNGQQMLVPMMATPSAMPFCGVAMMPMQARTEAGAGDLEAHAAALAARAQHVSVAAKRAKAAVQAARQAGHDAGATAKVQAVKAPKDDEARVGPDQRTTLMFRNLPNSFTRSTVAGMLEKDGFKGCFCFIYVPTDFKKFTSFGYAFVGFNSHEDAVRAKVHFQGFDSWESSNTCDVAWSGPVQGLAQHTERYRNSPVMHPSVPDEYKPAVYVNGERAEFPAPSKRIRPPRLRHDIAGEARRLEQAP